MSANLSTFLLFFHFSLTWACIPTISPDEDDLYVELSPTTSMLLRYSTSTMGTEMQSTTTAASTTTQTTTSTTSTTTTTTTTTLMCLNGWTLNPANGFCYLPYMTDMRFLDGAEMYCTGFGGHVVSIANQDENDFILMLAAAVSPPNSVYLIGLMSPMGSDTFTWTDGSPYDPLVYNNYAGGTAPPPPATLRCLAMYVNVPLPNNGKWINNGCAPAYGPAWFICKAPGTA